MRAGPLSDSRVLERLEREFVCTWVLADDLPDLAESATDERVRAVAKTCRENYLYPVDSQVLSPAGELLDHICANDRERSSVPSYLRLLDVGRARDGD